MKDNKYRRLSIPMSKLENGTEGAADDLARRMDWMLEAP